MNHEGMLFQAGVPDGSLSADAEQWALSRRHELYLRFGYIRSKWLSKLAQLNINPCRRQAEKPEELVLHPISCQDIWIPERPHFHQHRERRPPRRRVP